MLKMNHKMMYLLVLIMSTILVVSSSNWLTMWVGLEMNLMAFIPMFWKSKNNFMSESAMMYFLIQSLASIIFILSILSSNYLMMNLWENTMMMYMMMISMMMKLGMPPFHSWFPIIMNKLEWKSCLLLSTWQKMAPLYVSSQIMNNMDYILHIIYISTMLGAILGLNQTSTRKIMAYSSINHLGWMMACIVINKKLWMLYLLMYSLMMYMTFMFMMKYNIMYINQFNMKSLSLMDKLMMITLMLSIGGIPPLFGFLPKWMVIQNLIYSNELIMLLVMVMSSLLTLSYYLRMMSPMILMSNSNQKWMNIIFYKKSLISKMMMMHMMLPLFILLLNLN